MRAALAAALAAALCACASAPRPGGSVWVEAEGWAADEPGAPDRARSAALADAERRALEKGAGAQVSGLVRVERGALARDTAVSRVRGRLVSVAVMKERVEGGLRKVRVRARVDPRDDDSGPQLPPGRPRVAVDGPDAFRRAFAERGYELVDGPADFAVSASARTSAVEDPRVRPLVARRAEVSARVVDRRTGALLWSRSSGAAGVGADAASAEREAVERAGAPEAAEAADALSRLLWERL